MGKEKAGTENPGGRDGIRSATSEDADAWRTARFKLIPRVWRGGWLMKKCMWQICLLAQRSRPVRELRLSFVFPTVSSYFSGFSGH